MKTKTRNFFTAFLFAISCSFSLIAQGSIPEITFSTSGDQVIVKGSGFNPNLDKKYQVNVYVAGDFLGSTWTENGSFSYTTPKGKVSDGDKLTVKVLDFKGPGNHYAESKNVNFSGNNPNPPAPVISENKLRENADQQARTVANRVAATYGRAENWKYNFVNGYWMGMGRYSASNPYNDSNPDYRRGALVGAAEGTGPGREAGISQAQSTGNNMGASDAKMRFAAIVDTGRSPDLTINLPRVDYRPQLPNLTDDISRDLMDDERLFRTEIAQISFREGSFVVVLIDTFESRDSWTLARVYQYGGENRYSFIDSWFRGSYAYDEWKQNRLGGAYDYNIYNKLTPSQKDRFADYFRSIFDRVIDEKYARERNKLNPVALERGVYYGIRAGSKLAFRRGYNQSYKESFTSAAIRSFQRDFRENYESRFEQTSQYYMQNPVLEVKTARMSDDSGDGIFEIGESVGVSVLKVVNYGRVAASDLRVRINGQKGIDPTRKVGTFELAASSSNAKPLLFTGLATINDQIESNKQIPVRTEIAGTPRDLALLVSWNLILDKFGSLSSTDPEFAQMRKYVLKELKAEWLASFKARDNWFKSGKKPDGSNTKILDLVNLFESKKQDTLRGLRDDLVAIKNSGGGLHPFLRWHYNKLIKRLR